MTFQFRKKSILKNIRKTSGEAHFKTLWLINCERRILTGCRFTCGSFCSRPITNSSTQTFSVGNLQLPGSFFQAAVWVVKESSLLGFLKYQNITITSLKLQIKLGHSFVLFLKAVALTVQAEVDRGRSFRLYLTYKCCLPSCRVCRSKALHAQGDERGSDQSSQPQPGCGCGVPGHLRTSPAVY